MEEEVVVLKVLLHRSLQIEPHVLDPNRNIELKTSFTAYTRVFPSFP